MTITETNVTGNASANPFELVTLDAYRDVHKGIRSELFAVTENAGKLDPADRTGRYDLARHVGSVADLLVSHAGHEDAHVQPALELYMPELAAHVASDHEALEGRLVDLRSAAEAAVDAVASEWRARVHVLYRDLALFTSSYLAHQDLEEREIMPRLDAAIGFEGVLAINQTIIASIPPDEMASTLAIMIPAMNIDDRTELLGGMKAGAPPEVFTGVWSLVGSVLAPADYATLGTRLGM